MPPKIWDRTFRRIGWELEWLGPEMQLPGHNYEIRADRIPVDESIHKQLKEFTSLSGETILNFGRGEARNDLVVRPT